MDPENLRYTAEHEWAVITDSGAVRFGITEYAQNALGDVVFVTLPDIGEELKAGESCGEIESTKSVAEIYAPVTGVVVARNDAVETSPETINADPYGAGWLIEVDPADPDPLSDLLDYSAYQALVAGK